jgi:hypothetical protein
MSKTLIILPDIEDIILFKSGGEDKSNNDEYNKIRENIITNIFNLDDEYFNHPTYGEDWKNIQDKFVAIITPLCEEPFNTIQIKHMGGMSYNYDFLVTFNKNNFVIKTIKLEFKHNNSDVSNLVQFLELYDKDCKNKYEICSEMSYAEFYYDNYLDSYLSTDENIKDACVKPSKEEYLKNVYDIRYKHSFFEKLHSNKQNKMKEKKTIANESVKKYLEMYSNTFNFEKVSNKIRESQKEKVFLLWDCENFHTQILDVENIVISGIIKKDDLYFDVNVENFVYNIRVRLNWGNSNGLCNPRWKFSFIHK